MSVEVRSPRVTVQLPMGNARVTGITVSCSVGGLPTVSVSLLPQVTETGVQSPTAALLGDFAASAQSAMFSTLRQTLDCSLSIDDGADGTLDFSGYLANVQSSIAFGQISARASIVHEVAKLGGLSLTGYAMKPVEQKTDIPWFKSDSRPSKLIQQVVTRMVETNEYSKAEELPETVLKRKIMRDNAESILPILHKILNASEDSDASLKGVLADVNFGLSVRQALSSHLTTLLSADTPDFFNILRELQSTFQIIYVPSLENTDYGKFVSVKAMVGEPTEDVHPDILQLTVSDGTNQVLPIVATALVAGPSNIQMKVVTDTNMNMRLMYPEDRLLFTGGRLLTTPAPDWFNLAHVASAKKIIPTSTQVQDSTDLKKFNKKLTDLRAEADEVVKGPARDYLMAWTSNVFKQSVLAEASVTLVVPFSLIWTAGVCTRVYVDQTSKFVGWLHSVVHNLEITQDGKVGNATTTLTFTNVRFSNTLRL